MVSITNTTITLAWNRPASLGGRIDISYILWYQEDMSEELVKGKTVNDGTTMGTISGTQRQLATIITLCFFRAENKY